MQEAGIRLHGVAHAARDVSGLKGPAGEKHYTPTQIAELWGMADSTIRRLFQNEPGVIWMGEPSRRVGKTLKRAYWTMRIPESVVERVHRRLMSRKAA